MTNRFNSILDSLSGTKAIMLTEHINVVRSEIHLGCKRLNWNSLGRASYKFEYLTLTVLLPIIL